MNTISKRAYQVITCYCAVDLRSFAIDHSHTLAFAFTGTPSRQSQVGVKDDPAIAVKYERCGQRARGMRKKIFSQTSDLLLTTVMTPSLRFGASVAERSSNTVRSACHREMAIPSDGHADNAASNVRIKLPLLDLRSMALVALILLPSERREKAGRNVSGTDAGVRHRSGLRLPVPGPSLSGIP